MPEQGSKTTAYALQIPDDWDGETWDCCPLFFPDTPQWRAIVRGLLQHLVRGRSWDETTGTIVDVQNTARLIALTWDASPAVMALPEVMAVSDCMQRFADRLHEIFVIETIATSCCSELIAELPEPSPVIPGSGTPPGEHVTWEDYEAERCQIAQAIVDAFIDGAYQMSIHAVWGAAVMLAVIGVLFPAIRAAAALIGVLVPIGVQLWGSGTLEDFHSRIAAYKDDLVCALYTGGGYGATKQKFNETVDAGTFSSLEKLFLKTIMGYSDLNQLISGTANGTYASGYSSAFCNGCETEPEPTCYVQIQRGTYSGEDYYASTQHSGSHFVTMQIWTDSTMLTGSEAIMTVSNDSQHGLSFPQENVYRVVDIDNVFIHNHNTNYPENLCGTLIIIKHQVAFTVKVVWGSCC